MAEASQYKFDFRELTTLLIKQQEVHEGLWCIYIKFGIKAANMGQNNLDVLPTAMVPILEIGIQKTDKVTNLTIDAAEVNPAKPKKKRK